MKNWRDAAVSATSIKNNRRLSAIVLFIAAIVFLMLPGTSKAMPVLQPGINDLLPATFSGLVLEPSMLLILVAGPGMLLVAAVLERGLFTARAKTIRRKR